jgi:hypothetical protein
MLFFQTKNPNLGKLWRVLQRKMLVYFMFLVKFYGHSVYLWPFGMFVGHFVSFSVLVYCKKKNLATLSRTCLLITFECKKSAETNRITFFSTL